MDIEIISAFDALQAEGLAQRWDFNGKSGHRFIPKTANEAAALLNWAQENALKVAFSLQEAGLLDVPVWLDYSDLKQVRQYPVDDFIIEVETGITFGQLSGLLAEHRQCFPLTYSAEMRIGDILAEDLPALESGLQGYPRDYVLKTEIITPDGQITISGADVVKNVTGYDLAKLYVGGRHAFGLLTSVTLKLAALPERRYYWLYTTDSLHMAYALSEKLLASNLPLQICELYPEETAWRILIAVSGNEWVAADCQETLHHLTHKLPESLDEVTGGSLANQLQEWPQNYTLLEAALPMANWNELANALSKQSALSDMRLQIRPAAGLILLGAPFFPASALPYLKKEIENNHGFAQLLQISETDVATFSEAVNLFESFNLPTDSTVRRLLKELKKSYDPNSILFTPRLPL